MDRLRVSVLVAVAVLIGLAPARSARAQAEPPPVASKRLGVGYKMGNGLGLLGADLIVAPIDHVTFDLQANWWSVGTSSGNATGYGLAPAVQAHLFSGQVSSPYIGVGYVFAKLSLDGVTASASGVFANLGYEWRWASGLGILVGAGVGHLGTVHATNGVDTLDAPGGTYFNIESGLRFMFL